MAEDRCLEFGREWRLLETNVRVEEGETNQKTIHGWVEGASGEGRDGERDQSYGDGSVLLGDH